MAKESEMSVAGKNLIGVVSLYFLIVQVSLAGGPITGTASFRGSDAPPSGAVFEATMEDVSRADAASESIGRTAVPVADGATIRFEILYDEGLIHPNHAYSVRARILSQGRLMYVTDRSYPVLTRGHGREVALKMTRVKERRDTLKFRKDSSLSSLPATFVGVLPCADCPGIRFQLDLLPDHVFFQRMAKGGTDRSFDTIGVWGIAPDGRTLFLRTRDETPLRFLIDGGSALKKIDERGGEIRSKLDQGLTKADDLPIIEPRLAMSGMYHDSEDGGVFLECVTRLKLPVASELENAALESAYGAANRRAGEEILASVEGRIAMRGKSEKEGSGPALVVERFNGLWPGETCGAQFSPAKLENTYWKLTRSGDNPVIVEENQREPHFVLRSEDRTVAGFGGCNRLSGRFDLEADRLSFGEIAWTGMACPSPGVDTERAFHEILASTRSWKIEGEHLQLFDAGGNLLAHFEAVYLR